MLVKLQPENQQLLIRSKNFFNDSRKKLAVKINQENDSGKHRKTQKFQEYVQKCQTQNKVVGVQRRMNINI